MTSTGRVSAAAAAGLRAAAAAAVGTSGLAVRGVIESMSGSRFVHDRFEELGWEVLIADAAKVKGLAPLACKTDKIDARVLAVLSHRDLVPEIWLPDPRVRRERDSGWQMTGRRCEQRAISGAKPRPRDLPAEYLELLAQDQRLDVLDIQATATADECTRQDLERDVEEGEGHTGDPPNPTAKPGKTRVLAPFKRARLLLVAVLGVESGPRRGHDRRLVGMGAVERPLACHAVEQGGHASDRGDSVSLGARGDRRVRSPQVIGAGPASGRFTESNDAIVSGA
jgi:hypothetical protein